MAGQDGQVKAAPAAGAVVQKDKAARGRRKVLQGTVTSAKMQKTITVESVRMKLHPKYKKYVRRYTRYKAHDETEQAKVGDVVEIQATRPLSKTKRYRLVRVVRSSEG